jgi:hypothetical protein
VVVNGARFEVESPSPVYIPAEFTHSYRLLSGSGYFIQPVCHGVYRDSLL